MPAPELHPFRTFLSTFARRQAARTRDLPGGFAVYNDAFAHSWADNQVVIDGPVAPEGLAALADEVLGHLPHSLISVLDDEVGAACAKPLLRAGYSHSTYLVMLHTAPPPTDGAAEEVDLDTIRPLLTHHWRSVLPEVDDAVVRDLVDRRDARRRGADIVQFLGSRTPEGGLASWADLYLDPASGTAQIEDLVTAEPHRGRGHASAALDTALSRAANAGCTTRFLTADASDWPRHWYERKGFTPIGRIHCFARD